MTKKLISLCMVILNYDTITVYYLPSAVCSINDSGGVGNNTALLSSDKEFDIFSLLANCASYNNLQNIKTNTLKYN